MTKIKRICFLSFADLPLAVAVDTIYLLISLSTRHEQTKTTVQIVNVMITKL